MHNLTTILNLPDVTCPSSERNAQQVVFTHGGERERDILARPHRIRYDQSHDLLFVVAEFDWFTIDNKTHTILPE